MAWPTIAKYRAGAEVFRGDALCREKSVEFLRQQGLPGGAFPLEDIEEFGHSGEDGFMWLIQKKKKDHTFKEIRRTVSYAAEVTAFVEKGRIRRMTGVKTRELMMWFSVAEMHVEDPASGKVTFRTATGISDRFPASAFELID